MERKNASALWKVFKITDTINKKARCKVCASEYSFKSTTGNLTSHLRKRHKGVYARVAIELAQNLPKSRSEDSDIRSSLTNNQNILDLLLWNYFERENFFTQTARCNFCQEILSYKTSTADLKKHLRINHVEEYNDYLQDLKTPSDTHTVLADGSVANASSPQQDKDDDSNFSKKFCVKIWGHFELQDSTAHCTICEMTAENTIEAMKSHLDEAHPQVLENILNRETTDSTDAESVKIDEEDIFTEVLYLEEPKPRKSLKRKRSNPRTEDTYSSIAPNSDTPREISSFVDYITVLLLKVNKNLLSKLQVDIINMIAKRTDDGR